METDPKVSVLTPAYNTEKYIAEAIESILDQTFKDFEFIIIDDCSTDSTWQIIQEYAKKDSRIVSMRNDQNLGISRTRNKLIEKSKGKYIVWQDSDDISMPQRIEHQYAFMESHPEIGISGGYLQFFSGKALSGIRKYASDDVSLRRTIFRYSPVAQPAAIIRRTCFKEVGMFSAISPAAEDLALSFKIGTKYKFGNIQEIIIKYRENEANTTFTKLKIIELYTIFLREVFSRNTAYSMSTSDRVYNFLQYLSVYLIPAKIKIAAFNLIRNVKND